MSPAERPWPHLNPLRRWGPVVVVVAVLIAAGVVATSHTTKGGKAATAAAGSTTPADNPALPLTYQMAQQQGRVGDQTWSTGCDPATGRLAIPTVYTPPCVAVPQGDNGGATAPGVTATTITVAVYQAPPGDLASALQAQSDPPDVAFATAQKLVDEFNHLFTMSGRQVKLVRFQGSGISTDETAARADAIKVADDLHAFASLGGPAQTDAYENELAARGVLCVGCGLSVPDATFQQDAPYMWGTGATPDQLLRSALDYIVQRVNGRPASFAGDPAMRTEKRVFGIVHYDQDPPVFKGLTAELEKEYEAKGLHAAVSDTYLLDLARLPDEAATTVAHLKAAGVTSVIFMGDPIMPIYLTKAATAQNYFPEWIVTGTVLTDTTALGRLYDPKQWAHAFGVSSLAAPLPQKQGDAWRLYTWYWGQEPAAAKTIGVMEPGIFMLFLGIHMAGPKLNAQTFQGGMFRYPPTGGGPAHPRFSFGNRGVSPTPDYVGVDDVTEIWWDATAKGPDEQGKDGVGHYRYANGAKRYLPGQIPKTDSDAFKTAGSVLGFDDVAQLPAGDRPPNAPPWPGSPATQAGH